MDKRAAAPSVALRTAALQSTDTVQLQAGVRCVLQVWSVLAAAHS